MEMLALVLVLVVLAAVTPRYGADSRSLPAARRRSTVHGDVAALARWVRARHEPRPGRGSPAGCA